ncbi:MAG: DDE-type integrase/transposase/recombinase [Promethearchaeota archaeon]
MELELSNPPLPHHPAAVWIADETFVRVAGKQMYECKLVDWHGRTLARVLSPRRRRQEAQYLLQEATQRYPEPPLIFMHDANPIYHRALLEQGLAWSEGVVVHQREFVAADGSTTNPLEGHWSHFHVWRASHRGFKKWSHAQHYHEQYSRAKNQPNKTLLEMIGITRN